MTGNKIQLLSEIASWLRTRLFEVYVLIVSLFIGAVILVYLRWKKTPHEVRWFLRFWSLSFIYGARAIVGTQFRLQGIENVPDCPVIFVGNHQSYWESIAMTALFPHINVVTKIEAMAVPVFGWGLRYAPMIPVDRDMPGQNLRRLLKQGIASIREGRSVLIYPEGSRVPPRERRPFLRGLESLYSLGGCKVVPVVTNSGMHWPSGFKTKHPGVITLRFFPPLEAGGDSRKFTQEIENFLNLEKEKLLRDS